MSGPSTPAGMRSRIFCSVSCATQPLISPRAPSASVLKSDEPQLGAVAGAGHRDERLEEGHPPLAPETVGDREPVAPRPAPAAQRAEQRGIARREAILRKREVHRARHLRRRLAARARVGHRERGRDALRREEEVALLLGPQAAVEVEREAVRVRRDGDRRGLRRRCAAGVGGDCWSGAQHGAEAEDGERRHGVREGHITLARGCRWGRAVRPTR